MKLQVLGRRVKNDAAKLLKIVPKTNAELKPTLTTLVIHLKPIIVLLQYIVLDLGAILV